MCHLGNWCFSYCSNFEEGFKHHKRRHAVSLSNWDSISQKSVKSTLLVLECLPACLFTADGGGSGKAVSQQQVHIMLSPLISERNALLFCFLFSSLFVQTFWIVKLSVVKLCTITLKNCPYSKRLNTTHVSSFCFCSTTFQRKIVVKIAFLHL